MTNLFRRVYPSAQPVGATTDWFLFQGSQVLVREEAGQFLPLEGGLEVLGFNGLVARSGTCLLPR